MSIMESMRSGTDSTLMQVILFVVAASFIGWFASPQGDMASIVAEVNGVKILDTDFYVEQRKWMRGNMSDSEKEALGQRVKQKMIRDEVLLQEARALGLSVSYSEVVRSMRLEADMVDEKGAYDEERFLRWLNQNRLSQAIYEEQVEKRLLREKLQQLVYQSITVSEAMVKADFIDANTRVNLKTLRVRPTAFIERARIPEAERAEWISGNAPLIEEHYAQYSATRYTLPERVHLHVIRVAIPEGGDRISEIAPVQKALKEGASFAEVAKLFSDDSTATLGGDKGLIEVGMLDPSVKSAIEGLPLNTPSDPVMGSGWIEFLQVSERIPSSVQPLDEVREAIADRLYGEESSATLAAAFAESTLKQWTEAGSEPTEAIELAGLFTSESGLISLKGGDQLFTPPAEMMKASRTAQVGEVFPQVYERDGVMWLGMLVAREEADVTLFEAEAGQRREATLQAERGAFLNSWISDALANARIR